MGEKQVAVRFPESEAVALEAEAAWRGKDVSGLVSAVVASWLRNNDEEALARVAAWPRPTRFDLDDPATWAPKIDRVLVYHDGTWAQAQLMQVAHPLRWAWSHPAEVQSLARTGDLWLPLPSQGGS